MANKKNGKWYKNPWSILGWLVLILVVLIVLYVKTGFDPFRIVSWLYDLLASLWQAVLSALGGLGLTIGGGFGDGILHPGELPTLEKDCDEYNLAVEYDKYFGVTNMQLLETTCIMLGGKYTRDEAEVSCFLGHPFNVDCDSPYYAASKALCEDMGAKSVCDNTNGVYGCFCKEGGALIPSADEDNWECGEYYEEYGVCNGACSQGAPCVEKENLHGVTDCFCELNSEDDQVD